MSKTQDLLKKINYIEADIEIQKQILFSLGSEEVADIEKTVTLIAAKKAEIENLRRQIKESDPEEFERILVFEKAISDFRNLATTRQFISITGKNVSEPCVLALSDGTTVECLVKACDADGNWAIITAEGDLRDFPCAAVAEKPPASPIH